MPRGTASGVGGAPEIDAAGAWADEAEESAVVASDDGALKTDAVGSDSDDDDDDDDGDEVDGDDDNEGNEVDGDEVHVSDSCVFEEGAWQFASEALLAIKKAGYNHEQIMRHIRHRCAQWNPGDSRYAFAMASLMKTSS